jgi:polyphosphate kinase
MEVAPDKILLQIQSIVLQQQDRFDQIWTNIYAEMKSEKIYLVTEKELNKDQQKFVQNYFEEEARANIIPLMIQSIPQFPYLREKSLYLGVVLSRKEPEREEKKFALIEIPSRLLGRFVILPSPSPDEHHIILLEDVIRYNLKNIFSYFGYDLYRSWVFKVTKDAEIDIDNDLSTSLIEKIEKGLKNRRKGKLFVLFMIKKWMPIFLASSSRA